MLEHNLIILGSTGSIGINALKIVKILGIQIEALSGAQNIKLLNAQIAEFRPKFVFIPNPSDELNPLDSKVFIHSMEEMLNNCKSNVVLNAIVGFAGLKASLLTQKLNKKLILANKESLVVAGNLINVQNIIPIDSEHFSLMQILKKDFRKLYITASGGALRDLKQKDISNVSLEDVLKHPNWNMGKKITIDSATLVNKLYEILETFWIFKTKNIDALIEEKSLVHALIENIDGSLNAHICVPDMKIPISYAINQDKAQDTINSLNMKKLNIDDLTQIKFRKIDSEFYKLWIFKDTILANPTLGLVLNACNEAVLESFINKHTNFNSFFIAIPYFLNKYESIKAPKDYNEVKYLFDEINIKTKELLKLKIIN